MKIDISQVEKSYWHNLKLRVNNNLNFYKVWMQNKKVTGNQEKHVH